ncbi:hypothetical protein, partial [Bifidobacterium subtile]|uniref:hypothetical protein n=1 Tax=Bifidobacterium subtile TaxID=77635 RepID=UPI001F30EE43
LGSLPVRGNMLTLLGSMAELRSCRLESIRTVCSRRRLGGLLWLFRRRLSERNLRRAGITCRVLVIESRLVRIRCLVFVAHGKLLS